MDEEKLDNMQKHENYREQFQRLKKALDNGFDLEAIFIEYAILEDRTESILRHGGKWQAYLKKIKGREPNITTKVQYIQKSAECKKDIAHRYFSDNLLDGILQWKDERNRLIHALLKQQLKPHEVACIAQKGAELTKLLRTRVGSYNRALERIAKQAAVQKTAVDAISEEFTEDE